MVRCGRGGSWRRNVSRGNVSRGNVLSCGIVRCYGCGCSVVLCGWHSVVSRMWFGAVCGMLCSVV